MMKRVRSQLVFCFALTLLLSSAQVAVGVVVLPILNRPHNDGCDKAETVGDVTALQFDTKQATFDGPGLCMTGRNIWYCYTASCTGDVTVSLLGSSFDTLLAVYDGCGCDPTSNDLIGCNDDSSGQQSQVTFSAKAGNEYLIEVGGNDAAKGQGVMSISCDTQTPPDPPVSNDDCVDAESVGEVAGLYFDTTDATFDGPGLCMTSPNIWYCYTASCTGNVTVSLLGSSFDTMLAVYDGCGCDPESNDLVECNDDSGPHTASQIAFFALAGHQYLIEVGGYDSETGQGVLNIGCGGWPREPWPSNDDCYDADSIGDVTDLDFSTGGATFDGPGLCMTSPNIWYCYAASCTGDVTVSLAGSSFDTMLAVYNGCYCDPREDDLIDCNDDTGYDTTSRLTFAAIAGRRYLIEIGGYDSETGRGVLDISCGGPVTPGNADLGDAPDSSNNLGIAMTAYSSLASVQANYPAVFNDGSGIGPYGPVHLNSLAVAYLGEAITGETEADTGADDDGLNNIRPSADLPDNDGGDDGVVLPLNLPNCGWGTIDYAVTVVSPGTDLWVNVWLDFNRDGDWDDTIACPRGPARERAVQNQYLYDLPAGVNHITTPAFLSAHPKDGPKEIWMRITLSEQPWKSGSNPGEAGNAGSGPQAKYRIGETEDYYVTPETADEAGCPLCKDFNGDGVIDIDDLAAFTAEWLANCP